MNKLIKLWSLLLVMLVVGSCGSNEGQTVAKSEADIVYDAIVSRTSVRSYTDQKPSPEVVEKLLRAAMSAPTAGNKQPWEMLVIDDKTIIDQIPAIIGGARMASGAQMVIAVLGSPEKALVPGYWVQDCSAATENLLIAAHAMGLGAVWCGAYPENESGRVAKMSELLALPEGTFALNVIVIGYPDDAAKAKMKVKDKWDPAKVHYNKY